MTHIETTVGKARAKNVTIIGSYSQILPPDPVELTIDRAIEVAPDEANMIQEVFAGDDDLINGALADLEQHRILILAGERECGASTIAVYLATRLATQARLQTTLIVGSLDPKMEVDLWKLNVAKRTMVFTDSFHNHDLLGFFSRNDAVEWGRLTSKLRKNKAYLIFTAEPEAVAQFRAVRRYIPPPDPALVGRALDARTAWLERRGLLNPDRIRQITEQRTRLIETLRTPSRVAQFLDQFSAGGLALDEALKTFNDIAFWFSRDLIADIDAWCLALTLALAHVVRPQSGVGWYEFERIRRAITEQLQAGRMHCPSLSDDALLRRACAEVSGESSRLGDAVRFADHSYVPIIWQTLVTRHRRVLTTVIPTLRTIAEDEQGPGSYAVRSLAAQMLGRIGELDPFSISIPLVREWTGAQRPLIGRLLQGMRTSSNGAYRQAAIGAVDSLTTDITDDAKANDGLLTAIQAYSLLGERELALAIEKLGTVAVKKLAPLMTSLYRIERVMEQVEEHLSAVDSPRAAEDLIQQRLQLGHIAERLSAEQSELFPPFQQAVVYLCLVADPVEVLHETRNWIIQGGAETATLLALLYLHHGIADRLEAAATRVRALSGGEHTHPIARSLRNNAGAAEKYCAFLEDLRTGIDESTSLSAELCQELRKRLSDQQGQRLS